MGTTIDKVLFVFLFLKVFLSLCFAQCNLNNLNFDLALEPYYDDKLIVPQYTNKLMTDGQKITLFCAGGFENYGNRTHPVNVLNVRCEHDNLVSEEAGIEVNRDLTCRSGRWKEGVMPTGKCPQKKSYVEGFQIKDIKVFFSEICFNHKNFKLDYVYFLSGARSPLLSRLVEMNPITVTGENVFNFNLNTNFEKFLMTDDELQDNVRKIFKSAPINFSYKPLIPTWVFEPYYTKSLGSSSIQKAIFWDQLRDGNWKKFQDDLKARSEQHASIYDVFIGTSDISPGPPSTGTFDTEKNLTFKVEQKFTQYVPKFIWAYLEERGKADPEKFIVVFVNTPYFENVAVDGDIFCEDICDQIDWLKFLNPTHRMAAFGYTFCCKYSENVIQKLDGFPKKV